MTGSYNKVILMGRLTCDPELRHLPSGKGICKARIAVNDDYVVKATGEKKSNPCFVSLTIWDKRGEAFEKFHSKGSPCFVEGKLKFEQWEDKDGNRREGHSIEVLNWEFVDSKSDGEKDAKAQPADTVAEAQMQDALDLEDTPF